MRDPYDPIEAEARAGRRKVITRNGSGKDGPDTYEWDEGIPP